MSSNDILISPRFPRASLYNPEWLIANASAGANTLWLTEWLTEALELRPGMRVLDLGCGRAVSSIFLRRQLSSEQQRRWPIAPQRSVPTTGVMKYGPDSTMTGLLIRNITSMLPFGFTGQLIIQWSVLTTEGSRFPPA